MNIILSHTDIFDAPRGYYLINCISRDLRFTRLPGEFDARYHIAENIRRYKERHGYMADRTCVYPVADVLNLVVKEICYSTVDIDELEYALEELAMYCDENNISKIAMPKICCGRNGLDWEDVFELICQVLSAYDFSIMICVGE